MDEIIIITRNDFPSLERLWGEIASEEHPSDGEAARRAVEDLRRVLETFDFPDADSFRLFAAVAESRFVGYAATVRIPKADRRGGFLYIDELHVLTGYRRQGHATRLLEAAMGHAADRGLSGIRLLVRPGNAVARRLYGRLGFIESDVILCERKAHP